MVKGKGRADDTLLSSSSLKSACWYTVVKLIEEEELSLGITTPESFVASLTEAVWMRAMALGRDLESYASHAGRTTIGVEDVKLVARNNPALYELMSSEATKHGLSLAALKPKAIRAKPKPKAIAKTVSKTATTSKAKAKEKSIDIDDDDDDEDLPIVKPKPKPRAKKIVKKPAVVEDSD